VPCADDHCNTFDGASPAFKQALWAVIAINGVMFVVEMVAGKLGNSVALQADALDFFGDTFTYALSLFVIGMSVRKRASAAIFKGTTLLLMGGFILGTAVWRVFFAAQPEAIVMSGIALLALAANVASVFILIGFKDGDSNVRSVWLCSRNDAIGNVAVLGAGGLVALTGTRWPDLAVAIIMAGLFTWSAVQILRQATREFRHHPAPAE
jgi:cation diffusion facilitator family transporter